MQQNLTSRRDAFSRLEFDAGFACCSDIHDNLMDRTTFVLVTHHLN